MQQLDSWYFFFLLQLAVARKKCENEQPRARVLNIRTNAVSIGIKSQRDYC